MAFNFTNATVQTIVATVSMVGQIILLFVTLLAVIAGMAPTGATLSVGNLSGSFFNGAGALVQCFVTVKASKPLWDKFNKEAAVQEPSEKIVDSIPCITMHNVSFQYGERVVLHNKNYEFCAGGKYAIMGESGSGKTTLTKILMGLLHGYTGSVKYGSVDQHDVDLESLHHHIAYVDQQVYLFQDTLRFNITLGQSYSEEEIMAVIRKCKLEEYVAALPDGLDSMIMENGKNLSGGQRQRIALTRGLIRNVDYIILDEGTSALDENNAQLDDIGHGYFFYFTCLEQFNKGPHNLFLRFLSPAVIFGIHPTPPFIPTLVADLMIVFLSQHNYTLFVVKNTSVGIMKGEL